MEKRTFTSLLLIVLLLFTFSTYLHVHEGPSPSRATNVYNIFQEEGVVRVERGPLFVVAPLASVSAS